ncbi:hypothetical protein A2375_02010 [Candidatus Woesebacteria bacterium RIFOXYB1_FULL_31_120]|nr:MAG: hypothetical protein A2375_02010 [Candidatus Woesebacteria bacterium RIFOXYB1_FULL_31_120]
MSNPTTTGALLKNLNRIDSHIAGKNTIGQGEPLFGSIIEMIRGAQADMSLQYYESPHMEVKAMAESYNNKMSQYRKFTKGKMLSQRERDNILYGS